MLHSRPINIPCRETELLTWQRKSVGMSAGVSTSQPKNLFTASKVCYSGKQQDESTAKFKLIIISWITQGFFWNLIWVWTVISGNLNLSNGWPGKWTNDEQELPRTLHDPNLLLLILSREINYAIKTGTKTRGSLFFVLQECHAPGTPKSQTVTIWINSSCWCEIQSSKHA